MIVILLFTPCISINEGIYVLERRDQKSVAYNQESHRGSARFNGVQLDSARFNGVQHSRNDFAAVKDRESQIEVQLHILWFPLLSIKIQNSIYSVSVV